MQNSGISFAIGRYHFPKFKGIVRANYLSTCCPKFKGFFHFLNKRFTADSNALCPPGFFITIVSLDCTVHPFAVSIFLIIIVNLTHSNRCIFFWPGIATQSICVDLLGILEEILSYGIGGLYARHDRVYSAFLHEPFFDRFS